MPTDTAALTGRLFGFLVVLARVSGVIAFVPFPGFRSGPDSGRIVIAVMLTWCLVSKWPVMTDTPPGIGTAAYWVLTESAFGLTIGLFVSFLLEAFQLGAQVLGLQAGYSYASMIDPNTQADSGIIPVFMQLITGLTFFAAGIDREIVRVVAASLDRFPPMTAFVHERSVSEAISAGGAMLTTGLQVALPIIAFLLLVDVALALLGRIQSQLQLLSLAFPAKMVLALALLSILAGNFPAIFQSAATRTLQSIARALGN